MEGMIEAPARNATFLPVIKCSNCGHDVDMTTITDHQCVAAMTTRTAVLPIPSPLLPRTDSKRSPRELRPHRPPLPKIDLSATFLPPVFAGEITPASSGNGSMASPASATSGQRPPWSSGRKGPITQPRRPPSPELTNLDCAFPPFPLPSRAATTRRKDKSGTHRSDTKRSRSRDAARTAPKAAAHATGPAPSAGAGTTVPTVQIARSKKGAHPPNPAANIPRSLGPKNEQSRTAVEKLPEVQITPVETPILSKPAGPEASVEVDFVPKVSRSNTEPEPAWHRSKRHGLAAFNAGGYNTSKIIPLHAPSDQLFNDTRIEDKPRADTEPAYKSKRPPPLLSDGDILPSTKAKSATAPQSSSAATIPKSFGRLFGRRRSRSATSRREVVRQALSDEPDSYDPPSGGRSIVSPASDRAFLTAEPSPLTTSPLRSPEPSPSHEESLNALEGRSHTSAQPLPPTDVAAITIPLVVIRPTVEQDLPQSVPTAELGTATRAEDLSNSEGGTQAQVIEALRRMSVDSASSYGSIGFSEHTMSSRSSFPHPESLAAKSIGSADSTLLKPSAIEVPAPLRLKAPDATPDSPTDPLFQRGRLSPIPDLPQRASESSGWVPVGSNDAPTNTQQTPERDASPSNESKGTTPNKGICRGCSRMILAGQKSVSSADGRLTGRYHKECFVCQTCKAAFPTAEFYVHNDQPYCGQHYHELENSLCASCGKGIEGLYMETANVSGRGREKHHPECLKCRTCNVRLDHDYFELSGQVYCERDAFRLATVPKAHGNAPTRPSPLVREYISSGDRGLVSGRNFPERRTTRLMSAT